MLKAGLYIDNLHIGQLQYLICRNLNENNNKFGIGGYIVFLENSLPSCIQTVFPILHIVDGYCFDGVGISTSINTTKKLLNCPGPSHKIFYIWDLEWIRQQYNYDELSQVYHNENLHLITRNQEYKDIICNTWNIDKNNVAIVENFDIMELAKYIENLN